MNHSRYLLCVYLATSGSSTRRNSSSENQTPKSIPLSSNIGFFKHFTSWFFLPRQRLLELRLFWAHSHGLPFSAYTGNFQKKRYGTGTKRCHKKENGSCPKCIGNDTCTTSWMWHALAESIATSCLEWNNVKVEFQPWFVIDCLIISWFLSSCRWMMVKFD